MPSCSPGVVWGGKGNGDGGFWPHCPLLPQASTFPVISPESFFLPVKPVVGSQKISVECLIAAGVVFFFFFLCTTGRIFPRCLPDGPARGNRAFCPGDAILRISSIYFKSDEESSAYP